VVVAHQDRLPPSQSDDVSKTNDAAVVEKFCELARQVFQPTSRGRTGTRDGILYDDWEDTDRRWERIDPEEQLANRKLDLKYFNK